MTGYRVLVIDDSPFVFKAVKKALEPYGLQVVANATNGQVGLEMVTEYQPDVITLDVTMPVMDGIETARHLYARDPGSKVVMMSAMGDNDLLATARSIGVRHFVGKPFHADELLLAIQDLMQEKECHSGSR